MRSALPLRPLPDPLVGVARNWATVDVVARLLGVAHEHALCVRLVLVSLERARNDLRSREDFESFGPSDSVHHLEDFFAIRAN